MEDVNSNILIVLLIYLKYFMDLTLDQLNDIVYNLDQTKYCCYTQEALYDKFYFGKSYKTKYCGYQYGYYKYENVISYDDYIITPIVDELTKNKCCFVGISNNSTCDVTYGHYFTLFLIEDIVYRVESYGVVTYKYVDRDELIYPPRCLKLGTILDFNKEFSRLLTCDPDIKRLDIWNNMFYCNEEQDNGYPYLEISIKLVK